MNIVKVKVVFYIEVVFVGGVIDVFDVFNFVVFDFEVDFIVDVIEGVDGFGFCVKIFVVVDLVFVNYSRWY